MDCMNSNNSTPLLVISISRTDPPCKHLFSQKGTKVPLGLFFFLLSIFCVLSLHSGINVPYWTGVDYKKFFDFVKESGWKSFAFAFVCFLHFNLDSLTTVQVLSKLEIDQLRRSYHKLEHKASCAPDNCRTEGCSISYSSSEESVFIVGGFDGFSWLPDLSLYSPNQDHVIPFCSMSSTRTYAAVAKLNTELYIFGGTLDGVWCDSGMNSMTLILRLLIYFFYCCKSN